MYKNILQAGKPVDDVIAALSPLLDRGDILIDGGNSEKSDTTRRCQLLHGIGLHLYVNYIKILYNSLQIM